MDKPLSEQVIDLSESATITYEFECGDTVTIPTGEAGVIDHCLSNEAGNQYWINDKNDEGKWYTENQLKAGEKA